ncbi:MAG: DUF5664 domain-containing protein [Planctomycetaceae bacterium]|nr:DUF5664 domain-containing protein [Planctomycetaceae bacterium]
MSENRETFASGAVRDELPVRYDLCSPIVIRKIIYEHDFNNPLLDSLVSQEANILHRLIEFVKFYCHKQYSSEAALYILESYARTMHEGAAKYGERSWEKGIPENNLRNHAINHLVKLIGGDTSEPHLDHLIWNVLTIIHFREKEKETT